MKLQELVIRFGHVELTLSNQRAIFWKRKSTLILSDIHLGKGAHFRKNGIAVPIQISEFDLGRLAELIDHYEAKQVIVVGDLIHAGMNKEVVRFSKWREQFEEVSFCLIKGNHDRLNTTQLTNLGIDEVYHNFDMDGLHFTHEYILDNALPAISGHAHPGVRIQLPTKQYLKFPCYVVSDQQIILPAFSLFSGLDTSVQINDAVYYAFYEEGIFKVVLENIK